MKILILAATLAIQTATLSPASPAPTLAPLRFLAGDWQAVATPAGEEGGFSFRFTVQDRVMIRDNYATYAATPDRAASRHEDLMVVFVEGAAIKADYVDNEAHVIHYAVQVRGDRDVVFVSASKVSEPGYRLSYSQDGDGLLKGRFEIAAPGTDAFTPYLTWSARRRR